MSCYVDFQVEAEFAFILAKSFADTEVNFFLFLLVFNPATRVQLDYKVVVG